MSLCRNDHHGLQRVFWETLYSHMRRVSVFWCAVNKRTQTGNQIVWRRMREDTFVLQVDGKRNGIWHPPGHDLGKANVAKSFSVLNPALLLPRAHC